MSPVGNVEDDSKLECFPIKLMEIINDEANSDIITWTPEGNGFVILNKNRLAVDVLPKVFKMTQYTSFTRRLKRWGFIIGRTTHGSQTSSYHHPLFTRDDVSNVLKMRPLSRRHQYRKQVGNESKQYGTDTNQMHQIIPPCMIPLYNVPGLNPNYAVPMSYYDQLGLINLTSTIPSSRLPGMGNMNMMPNTQTTIPAYGNYSENFRSLPIMNHLLSSRGNHRNLSHAEALHMMLNSNAEAVYANSHSNYTMNGAQIQVPSVISQNGSSNSYQSDPSHGHEHSVNRDRSLYYSPNRYS